MKSTWIISVRMDMTTCTTNSFCSSNVANSTCGSNGLCVCALGYQASTDQLSCIDVMIGSRTCSASSDCTSYINNTVCTSAVCQCATGYKVQNSNTECNARVIGDSCSSSADCSTLMSNSNCSSNVCACVTGFRSTSTNTACEKGKAQYILSLWRRLVHFRKSHLIHSSYHIIFF